MPAGAEGTDSAPFPRADGLFYYLDDARRSVYGVLRKRIVELRGRNRRIVVGSLLPLVRIGQKPCRARLGSAICTCQASKLTSDPGMGFRYLSSVLEYGGLRRVKRGEIGFSDTDAQQIQLRELNGVIKTLMSLGQIHGCFRLQRSSPSLRISCMSGVLSVMLPARNGFAEMYGAASPKWS